MWFSIDPPTIRRLKRTCMSPRKEMTVDDDRSDGH
jgi:hypothetical protein